MLFDHPFKKRKFFAILLSIWQENRKGNTKQMNGEQVGLSPASPRPLT